MSKEILKVIGQLQYEISLLEHSEDELTGVTNKTEELKNLVKKLNISDIVVPKRAFCWYCNNTGWDSYPNHDATPRPCPECQP